MRKLCSHYYPNGKDEGHEYRLGSVMGEPGTSFTICLEGEKAGVCCEHNDDSGMFFTKALATKLGITVPQAEAKIRLFLSRGALGVPPVLSGKALYGVVGRIARKAAAASEADDVGVLAQFLVAFG